MVTVHEPGAAVAGIVRVRDQTPSWVVPEVRVIDPNPAVWVVESESTIIVGAVVPVASVTRAETVTCLAPSLTSTLFGVKSKSDNTGAAVSGAVLVTVSLVGLWWKLAP